MNFSNIFYFNNINSIGGVESFFYYLVKKYQDYDITILYKTGDIKQLKRLQKYVRTIQYNGEKIKCKKAFFNYNKDIIDNIEADEYIEIIHRDPLAIKKWDINSKITKYIGVSQLVCDHFKQLTKKDCQLIYNPLDLKKPKKVLNLISATRLTAEKGKDRIAKLAKLLDAAHIPYLWTIFTNDVNTIKNPNIVYMEPKLDILDYIANADYLVQLSDDESFCYSVVEALSIGTPVIVTDIPVFKEIGVENGKNGWICDFNMENIDVEKIYNSTLKFTYEPPKTTWDKELIKGHKSYKISKTPLNTVKAIENFSYENYDKLQNLVRYNLKNNKEGILCEGDIFDCDNDIKDYLLRRNRANRPLIEVLYDVEDD